MNQDKSDIQMIEQPLRKLLFESHTPEEGITIILQHPQLLSKFVDNLFVSLINSASKKGNEDLVKLYRGRQMLLQTVKEGLSNKDLALLYAVKQLLSKKDRSANSVAKNVDNKEVFELPEIMLKLLAWLKAPTLEQGVKVLQQHPELLTDKPIKLFGLLMDESHKRGDEMFVQVLKALREFFQTVRMLLMDKKDAIASQAEITQAVKKALAQTEFSTLLKKQEFSFLA
ncbi:MAG: hypothetical protein DRR19_15085 [Candidatus Parabeggiatoa sp. nov. 1]|nr:MAG: hypothetical protein DRR19_15085 [Gammaproteobacteria bacterium]HEC85718.1 hypothetical protein [Thioploca sp.]